MGNAMTQKPRHDYTHPGPVFRTPITDYFSQIGHFDGTKCENFELRLYDCLEAYGPIVGKHRCKLYAQDADECMNSWKQEHRQRQIRLERQKQWMLGVVGVDDRKTPFYYDLPTQDGFAPDVLTDLLP